MNMKNSVQIAVDALGSQRKLAQRLHIKRQAVNAWVKKGKIPAERVIAVENVTGISRKVLRPDLYPSE